MQAEKANRFYQACPELVFGGYWEHLSFMQHFSPYIFAYAHNLFASK
jgi:hypothetical protein